MAVSMSMTVYEIHVAASDLPSGGCPSGGCCSQGEEFLLTENDRQPDSNPTVEYYSVRRAPAIITLEEWCERQQKRRDSYGNFGSGGEDAPKVAASAEPYEYHQMTYDDFHSCFEQMNLSDMVGHKSWAQDVQAVLWRYFDLISYVMYAHGAGRGANRR